MRKRLYIAMLMLGAMVVTGCGSSNTSTTKAPTKSTKSTGSKTLGGGTTQGPLSKPTETPVKGTHATNCKKLGVQPSSSDNVKLYSECASWIGAPYKYGGTSRSGVDCSGLTYLIYKAVYGKTLTRQSGDMLTNNCKKISKSDLREGDLVFFRTDGKRSSTPNHVGIYLKNNKFIHSSTSKGVVVSDLTQEYYVTNWIAGGRVK